MRVFFFSISPGAGGTFPLQPDISMSGDDAYIAEIARFVPEKIAWGLALSVM